MSITYHQQKSSIENKLFFYQPVKNKQEAHKKLIKMNNDYTTGKLLDYLYHQIYYKLSGIYLSRQTHTNVSQQINFTGKVDEDVDATMKSRKKYFQLFSRFKNCKRII